MDETEMKGTGHKISRSMLSNNVVRRVTSFLSNHFQLHSLLPANDKVNGQNMVQEASIDRVTTILGSFHQVLLVALLQTASRACPDEQAKKKHQIFPVPFSILRRAR